MNARLQRMHEPALRAMQLGDLDAIVAIEQQAYAFPWSRGNFIDSLAAGYEAWVLVDQGGFDAPVLGYYLAMKGVDEMHLLNITVAPSVQGQGLARRLLNALCQRTRELQCSQFWLEVRRSNEHARQVYLHWGFAEVGLRRGYYPAGAQREDAVLMSLSLESRP